MNMVICTYIHIYTTVCTCAILIISSRCIGPQPQPTMASQHMLQCMHVRGSPHQAQVLFTDNLVRLEQLVHQVLDLALMHGPHLIVLGRVGNLEVSELGLEVLIFQCEASIVLSQLVVGFRVGCLHFSEARHQLVELALQLV